MKLATTTGDFGRYSDSYYDCIKWVSEAGFRYLDLSLYNVKADNLLFYGDNWREEALKIKEYAESLGCTFVQCHSPNTNNLGDNENSYSDAVFKTKRAVEICGILGIPNIVVHAGWNGKIKDKETWFKENKRFYSEIFPLMEENNVNVLCENSTVKNMGDMYYLISGKDMKEFCSYVNHPLFHACWDTGHANCEGNQYDDILAIGDDLYAVHFNDNRGTGDEHIIPFMGTVNVNEVIDALIEIGFRGPLTFESDSSLRPYDYWQGDRRRYEKTKSLANPPLELQKELERFLFRTGEIILSHYT